jgi:hypothetical protein
MYHSIAEMEGRGQARHYDLASRTSWLNTMVPSQTLLGDAMHSVLRQTEIKYAHGREKVATRLDY